MTRPPGGGAPPETVSRTRRLERAAGTVRQPHPTLAPSCVGGGWPRLTCLGLCLVDGCVMATAGRHPIADATVFPCGRLIALAGPSVQETADSAAGRPRASLVPELPHETRGGVRVGSSRTHPLADPVTVAIIWQAARAVVLKPCPPANGCEVDFRAARACRHPLHTVKNAVLLRKKR